MNIKIKKVTKKIKKFVMKRYLLFLVCLIILMLGLDYLDLPKNLGINLSERYDWLGFIGSVIGSFVTIIVFKITLEVERKNRQSDFLQNQKLISQERRMSNIPILTIKGNFDEKSKKLSLNIENIGLNHAILNAYKLDWKSFHTSSTRKLGRYDDKPLRERTIKERTIKKDDSINYDFNLEYGNDKGKPDVIFIYYTDIFRENYYRNTLKITDDGKLSETEPLAWYDEERSNREKNNNAD